MTLEGKMLIGQQAIRGQRDAIFAINPATNHRLEPAYPAGRKKTLITRANSPGTPSISTVKFP